MIVWFHSVREQSPEEGEPYEYDSYIDSGLFANLTACSQDSENKRNEELRVNAERYRQSMNRWEERNMAIETLKSSGFDAKKLWFNNSEDPPKFVDPPERFIYFLEVSE